MRATRSKKRLDGRDVLSDQAPFREGVAIAVRGSVRYPLEDDVDGRAQQNDRIEPVEELP